MATQIIRVGRSGVARVNVDVRGLAGQAIKDMMIKTAREAHVEEMQRGFDPDPRRIVDGRYDAAIISVKPFGRIVLADRVPLAVAALEVREQMRRLSKVKTGAYRGSITIFVERTQVDPSLGAINAALRNQPDAAIVVAPMVLYARRLERRYRIVDATWRLMARRFGGSMFVSKHTVYAGEVNLSATVKRHYTHGKRLAESMTVEAVFPGIRIYRHARVGASSSTVH
jgi:hypothetical protein